MENVTWESNNVTINATNNTITNESSGSLMVLVLAVTANIVLFSEATLAIVSNLLALTVIIKSRNNRLSRHYFMCSLSVADLLTALSVYIAFFTVYPRLSGSLSDTVERYTCGLILFLLSIANTASLWSTVAIAVERYVQIIHSLVYWHYFTNLRTVVATGVIWSVTVTINIISFSSVFQTGGREASECIFNRFTSDEIQTAIVVVNTLPYCLVAFFYGRIFHTAFRQQRRIKNETPVVLFKVTSGNNEGVRRHYDRGILSTGSFRIAKMFAQIIGFLFVTSILYLSFPHVSKSYVYVTHKYALRIYKYVTYVLFLTNTFLNPFIYQRHDKQFRRNLRRLLRQPLNETES